MGCNVCYGRLVIESGIACTQVYRNEQEREGPDNLIRVISAARNCAIIMCARNRFFRIQQRLAGNSGTEFILDSFVLDQRQKRLNAHLGISSTYFYCFPPFFLQGQNSCFHFWLPPPDCNSLLVRFKPSA